MTQTISVLRRVAGLLLMLAGGLACAYGALILASITGGTRLLRRHRTRT